MGKPLHILLVEDNPFDVLLLRGMFATETPDSYRLTHCSRLADALDHLARGGVDIVLLDLGLPDGQGIETVRSVRGIAADVPLIVLTGLDDENVVMEAMREGAQDYLVKGQVENRALPRALRHAIDRFALETQAALSNVELKRRIHEKDILLGEIHHRVKNSLQMVLSLLSMEAARIRDETIASMLHSTQNRIRSMAAIHQTLYQSKDFARMDFGAFLHSFVPTLVQTYSLREGQVALTIAATKAPMQIESAIPCGLIINELVSNALKHGFPNGRDGKIHIEFGREGERCAVLSVRDDGVGLPEGFSFQGESTLGTQLIYLLSKQLGGTVSARQGAETCFRVEFPLAS